MELNDKQINYWKSGRHELWSPTFSYIYNFSTIVFKKRESKLVAQLLIDTDYVPLLMRERKSDGRKKEQND